jgi:large repetitive protein
MSRKCLAPLTLAGLIAFLSGVAPASAQAPPSLGAAQSYAVLGGSTVTAGGTGTVITGDVGVSPGTSITGFPGSAIVVPPFSTHANDASAVAAQASVSNVGGLYTTLVNFGGSAAFGTPLGAELGNTTLGPGTYIFSSTANVAATTTLTLSGAGTYVFKVGSGLTANVGSRISLINGASACNVFWQVTSAATLNGVTFAGTVVAQAGVTLGVGAALTGRALTTTAGAVSLSGGNTVGGCSASGASCPVITLSPPTLPNGTVAVAYSQTITASGGTAPYTFTVTSGTLPSGLVLTAAGVLAGTPTTAGTFTFTVRGTDAQGCFGAVAYTIVIAAAAVPPVGCPAITLSPPTVPPGTVGVAYSQTITGSGGTAPYSFGVTSGTLPAGLTLTAGGVLAGTPTTAGSSTVTIRGTDANGCFGTIVYTIVIAAASVPPAGCPVITLSPLTAGSGTVGVAYSRTFTASGGTAPYTFGVTNGALPPGLTLTAAGVLSGTPTTSGLFTFTIRGTDANGCFGELTYVLPIGAAVPTLPQIFVLMLGLGLAAAGYVRLRGRARMR